MSVGQVRTLVQRGAVTGEPTIRNDDPTLSACTYLGRDDPANDALPVTCVGHRLASDVCAALGRRLPTEAEWELAAGNGTRETTFPWGEGSDVCAHAVVARGRALVPEVLEETSCLDGSFRSTGPVPGGSDKDVTGIGIYNLGGNVSEWVEDRFAPYASPCLGDGSTLEDPVCRTASSDTHVVRGGSWASRPLIARSTSRNGARAATGDPYIGFRCALTLAE
jgi:formylglycine-generating enzyme required for sulfatase activity